jgi:Ulp1 family protease
MAAGLAPGAVTYHGTTLYDEDIALLRPSQWLNDSLVTFAMDYLAHKVHGGDDRARFCHPG